LDIGAGIATNAYIVAQHVGIKNVYCTDYDNESKTISTNVLGLSNYFIGDIEAICFPDDIFWYGILLARYWAYFRPNFHLLKEIYRITRRTGKSL